MVVDIGTMFIKYSLISSDGENDILVKADIKESSRMLDIGLNYNLLKRDIERKYTEYSKISAIDTVIVIPPRQMLSFILEPRLEYRDNEKELKEQLKALYKNIESKDSIFDWAITEDNSDKDYHSVIVDSIPVDVVYGLNSILVNLKVNDFLITTNLTSMIPLTSVQSNEPTVVIDIGHRSTTFSIVKDGNILVTKESTKAGLELTSKFGNETLSFIEKTLMKHNSEIEDYPSSALEVLTEYAEIIKIMKEEYNKYYKDNIESYCVIGGGASIDLARELDDILGMKRVIPNFSIINDHLIPFESRSYFSLSLGAVKYALDFANSNNQTIDFSASKSGGMGLKIKKASYFFERNKYLIISAIASIYLLAGSTAYYGKDTKYYLDELKQIQSQSNSQLATLNEQQGLLEDKIYALQMNVPTEELSYDTGLLLENLVSITPPNFNIKKIQLYGDGSTGVITVASESQVNVSTFMTLLQDSSGSFNKANIMRIDTVTDKDGKQYYETDIFVEGRKL